MPGEAIVLYGLKTCDTCRKAKRELGYVPRHSFEDGLAATLRWYLDNEDWWKPLLSR